MKELGWNRNGVEEVGRLQCKFSGGVWKEEDGDLEKVR